MQNLVVFLTLFILCFEGAAAPKYRVVAYVSGGHADLSQIGANKLTHINYAFGLVNTNGEAFIRANAPAHFAQLQSLKADNPDLKVVLSIGGWGADNFSDAALTDESRRKFAKSCVDILKLYALDGIDLDWEYPGQAGPGIKFRAEDKENFTFMLAECRRQLDEASALRRREGDDRYLLTIASAGHSYFKHTEMEKVHRYLDFINIMTYDLYGSFSGAGHHSGLRDPHSADRFSKSAEGYVQEHLASGIPASKLVVGAAFYSKVWTNVATLLPRPEGGKFVNGPSYAALKRDYINKNGFERSWDKKAQSSYLWKAENRTFISFEDPQALKAKCDFVKKLKLGGLMYWEYSNDLNEELLDVVARELRQ